jgi:hypothetical protein
MPTITNTTPTYTQIEAPVILTSGPTLGTLRTLDLRTKQGALLYVRMGRRVVTALTRAAYVAIRRTDNDAIVIPSTIFDVVSQITTCVAPTLSANNSIGDGTIAVSSAAGLAVGDVLCIADSGSASRNEFVRIAAISGTTVTLERNLRAAHSSGDLVTNLADVAAVYIPGGEHYEIRCINNSGQSMLFAIDAVIDEGETY